MTVILERGSIVFCKLVGNFEHSGVYLGEGRIAEVRVTNGRAKVVSVSLNEFLTSKVRFMSGGLNAFQLHKNAMGCVALGKKSYANYAEKFINKEWNYKLVGNNCHNFTISCIEGRDYSNSTGACFFWELKQSLANDYSNGYVSYLIHDLISYPAEERESYDWYESYLRNRNIFEIIRDKIESIF